MGRNLGGPFETLLAPRSLLKDAQLLLIRRLRQVQVPWDVLHAGRWRILAQEQELGFERSRLPINGVLGEVNKQLHGVITHVRTLYSDIK